MDTDTIAVAAEPAAERHSMSERFMRQVWLHGDYDKKRLITTGGVPVTIMDPGTVNMDAGPDFLNARVRIGNMQFSGDIELHRFADDWAKHGHDRDPRYNSVVLHVALWEGSPNPSLLTQGGRTLQTVLLHKAMGSLPEALSRAVKFDETWREGPLACAAVNGVIDVAAKREALGALADIRFARKERAFKERALAIAGGAAPTTDQWEQVFYEGVLEALGFAKNRAPFRALAEGITLALLRSLGSSRETIEGALFGAAGLLADAKSDSAETGAYLTELRAQWETVKAHYRGPVLARSDWQWLRLRPQNFPPVRIAGAAVIAGRMLHNHLFDRLIELFRTRPAADAARKAMHESFDAPADGFWKNNYDFGSRWSTPAFSLVGPGRADDIAVNIVFPFVRAYADVTGEAALVAAVTAVAAEYRAAGDNDVTQRVERWLLPGGKLATARVQQGAIELFTVYCTPERCLECAIGKAIAGHYANKSSK
jgi:hypothetical protein